MMVEVTQADREAAWPLRPECYTQRDYERWMGGLYDNNNVGINRLSAHRIQSTAELQSKLDKVVEALENIRDIEKPMFGEQPERDWLAWYSTASQMAELADDALITVKSERDE